MLYRTATKTKKSRNSAPGRFSDTHVTEGRELGQQHSARQTTELGPGGEFSHSSATYFPAPPDAEDRGFGVFDDALSNGNQKKVKQGGLENRPRADFLTPMSPGAENLASNTAPGRRPNSVPGAEFSHSSATYFPAPPDAEDRGFGVFDDALSNRNENKGI